MCISDDCILNSYRISVINSSHRSFSLPVRYTITHSLFINAISHISSPRESVRFSRKNSPFTSIVSVAAWRGGGRSIYLPSHDGRTLSRNVIKEIPRVCMLQSNSILPTCTRCKASIVWPRSTTRPC